MRALERSEAIEYVHGVLIARRKRLKYSQRALSAAIGIARNTLTKIENEPEKMPSLRKVTVLSLLKGLRFSETDYPRFFLVWPWLEDFEG